MTASIWNPGGTLIPQVDPNSQIKSEAFTAIAGQTLFTLTTFTYVLGVGALSVYRNGVKQVGTDVTETSTSSITLAACEAGDVIEVVGNTAIADPVAAAAVAVAAAAESLDSAAASAASAIAAAAAAAAITIPLPASSGGTGLTSLAATKIAMSLDNVNNTSDADKPISTAAQSALDVHTAALALRVAKDSDTGSAQLPVGTTAQRTAAPSYGMTRVNSSLGTLEWWNGTIWTPVGGSSTLGLAYSNKLINGNFAINQRAVSGTVVLAAGQYGHDRFKAGAGGCTYTFATVNNVTTLTISAGTLMQVIEGANLLSGTHTLSWVGTAQGRIDAGAYGISGMQGTAVGGTNQTCEWGTGTLSRVQYEPGTVATVFENRHVGAELALCQRYYEQMPIQLVTATQGFGLFALWKTTKRATPTLSLAISSGSGATVDNTSAIYNLTGVVQNAFNSAIASGTVTGTSEL